MTSLFVAVSQTPAAHGGQFAGGVVLAVIIVLLCSGRDKK
jgi:hypothetical protein